MTAIQKRDADNQWENLGPSEREENDVDQILSDDLLRLTFLERNNINEEIHGVRNDFPEWKEDSECVELSLLEMDIEVESIIVNNAFKNRNNNKDTLRFEHIPTNRELRLTFLRNEFYDTKRAANRLVAYIRFIREHCACRKGVTGCDCGSIGAGENGGRIVASKWFSKEDYTEMKKGTIQLMPFRDRSGRRVLIAMSSCFNLKSLTRLKIIMYVVAGASEDVETQKSGIVLLIWPGMCSAVTPSSSRLFYPSIYDRRYALDVQMSLPLRVVCIHFGKVSSPLLRLARIMLVLCMHEGSRLRFNIITGTKTELNYKIMSFGIHPAMIPVAEKGKIKTRNHVQWLDVCESIEKDPYGTTKTNVNGGAIVVCPGVNDVLFYRGKSCQYHPGNVAFRSMIESKKGLHMKANQTMKNKIAWGVMEEVEDRNGRFLYWDKSGWWVEFKDRTEVRHKVATSLRDFNKQIRAANNCQNINSSTDVFRSPEAKRRKRNYPLDGSNSPSDCSCACLDL